MNSEISRSADLFWQAFRYAGNEMSPAERLDFDALLATDQGAREAVARVIELEGLVLAAESAPIDAISPLRPATTYYWMQPMGWVAMGAAACLAAVMAFQAWWPTGSASLQPGIPGPLAANANREASDAIAAELALAWAQAQAQLPAADDSAFEVADHADRDQLESDHIEQDIARVDDEQLAAAPAWLLAAVADTAATDVEN